MSLLINVSEHYVKASPINQYNRVRIHVSYQGYAKLHRKYHFLFSGTERKNKSR